MQTPQTLCQLITHGVYVIAVTDGQHDRAFTAAWVMQVSFEPLLPAFSINPRHGCYAILKSGGRCTINVLAKQQLSLAAHFGRSGQPDKMAGHQWQKSKAGVPVLTESLGYFDCRVSKMTNAGDHELVVCEVLDAVFLNTGEPMLYRETGNMDGMGL
ncbi:MAG: flavin reductase family protein [Methylococcales bacterium]